MSRVLSHYWDFSSTTCGYENKEIILRSKYTLQSFSWVPGEWHLSQANVFQPHKVIPKICTKVYRVNFLSQSDYSSIQDYLASQLYEEMETVKKTCKYLFWLELPSFPQQNGQLVLQRKSSACSDSKWTTCMLTWTPEPAQRQLQHYYTNWYDLVSRVKNCLLIIWFRRIKLTVKNNVKKKKRMAWNFKKMLQGH